MNQEPVKIETLMIRNFKRVHIAEVEFTQDGLTVIGGANAQGKSTFLDGVKFLLGGKKYAPTNPHNIEAEGATATVRATLSNGVEVERSGKSSTLKVLVDGKKGNQGTLKEFLNEFALDIDKFMRASETDKGKMLIEHLGIGEKLEFLETKIKSCFDDRTLLSREVKRKLQLAEACPTFEQAPAEKVDLMGTMATIREQQDANGQHDKGLDRMQEIRTAGTDIEAEVETLNAEIIARQTKIEALRHQVVGMRENYSLLQSATEGFERNDTTELELTLTNAEAINTQVDANVTAAAAVEEHKTSKKEEQKLTDAIDEARAQRNKLIDDIQMPLADLKIEDGNLIYKGERWDCMSGSQRLIVATAIARAFKPECGFVLVDELEQLDWDTINVFDAWAKSQKIQVIGAMVCADDKKGENVIIISDGKVAE